MIREKLNGIDRAISLIWTTCAWPRGRLIGAADFVPVLDLSGEDIGELGVGRRGRALYRRH
jgi:hypothetical protein